MDLLTFAEPEFQLCPFPAYDKLRDSHPVYQDPGTGHSILPRYDDVRAILLNPSVFSNRTGLLGNRWCDEANQLFADKGW